MLPFPPHPGVVRGGPAPAVVWAPALHTLTTHAPRPCLDCAPGRALLCVLGPPHYLCLQCSEDLCLTHGHRDGQTSEGDNPVWLRDRPGPELRTAAGEALPESFRPSGRAEHKWAGIWKEGVHQHPQMCPEGQERVTSQGPQRFRGSTGSQSEMGPESFSVLKG